MKHKPTLQRIAQSLGRKSLSEEEFAALDLKVALDDRLAELKAKKAAKHD